MISKNINVDAISADTDYDVAVRQGVHSIKRGRVYVEVTSMNAADSVTFSYFRLYRKPSDGTLSIAGESAIATAVRTTAGEDVIDLPGTEEVLVPDGFRIGVTSTGYTSPVTADVKVFFEQDDD